MVQLGVVSILESEDGICYTRTGRRFFEDAGLERDLLATVRRALDRSGFWERFDTDWVCLDCELMPWSVKALELVRQQYASVGAAARVGLREAVIALERAAARGVEVGTLLDRHRIRLDLAGRFVEAYRHYCWPVASLLDIRIAPFHVMATEGAVHVDKDHVWHMDTIGGFVQDDDPLLLRTPYRQVDLADPSSEAAAIAWWEAVTAAGGEGVVVKPHAFVVTGARGLVQPAVKCRGREYLRIIYGPEYTLPEHLQRLRERGLSAKRSLALREFALASRRSNDSSSGSRSGECTSACSGCWRWRASPSIRGCRSVSSRAACSYRVELCGASPVQELLDAQLSSLGGSRLHYPVESHFCARKWHILCCLSERVRVRLTRKFADVLDGVDVSRFSEGDVIDLPARDAYLLIAEHWAEPEFDRPARAEAADREPRRRRGGSENG